MSKCLLHDEFVDAIVSRYALHYSRDIVRAITEAARVLKAGGMFAVVMSHPSADCLSEKDEEGNVTKLLFNGAVSVTYPQHTMTELFSHQFLKLFDLKSIYEFTGQENDVKIKGAPTALCFVAIKR